MVQTTPTLLILHAFQPTLGDFARSKGWHHGNMMISKGWHHGNMMIRQHDPSNDGPQQGWETPAYSGNTRARAWIARQSPKRPNTVTCTHALENVGFNRQTIYKPELIRKSLFLLSMTYKEMKQY
eukprot:796252-Amphidinium_carterae.1